ncbi:MAG: hypothetical protein J0L65_06610 [Xanthomonadales bacterium]|nr:hypothetical protein [Xanthomonadales bacterium]
MLILSGAAGAQSLTASSTVAGTSEANHATSVTFTAGSPDANSFNFQLNYDNTRLTFDSVSSSNAAIGCSNPAAGQVLCFADAGGTSIPLNTLATSTITVLFDVGATVGVTPLTITNVTMTSTNGATMSPTVTNGQVDVQAVAAPTVSYGGSAGVLPPNGPSTEIVFPAAALGSTGTLNVTADVSGGTSGQSVTFSACSVTGAGLSLGTVSPTLPATVNNGDPSGDTDLTVPVQCAYAASARTGSLTCTETPSIGTAVTNTWDISCPAGDPSAPVFSSVPAPGSTLNCDGDAGTTETTSVTVTNTGDAVTGGPLTFSCTAAGAGFSITSGGSSAGRAVGAPQTINIACVVPAEGEPAATGTVTCTTNAGTTPTYNLSSLAQTLPDPVPQPNVVPASSLWSKLALIGLLAGLGIAVVGFRRS